MRFASRTLALTFAALLILPAAAQDTQGMIDRINRLERDLNTLQAQVYRGQSGKVQSSGGSADAGVSGGGGGAYGMLDSRISSLEDQLRQTTGDLEKYQYELNQLKAKLDRVQQDDDFRFKQLEEKGAAPASSAAAVVPPVAGVAEPDSNGNRPGPGSPPGFLGQPKTGDRPLVPPPAADAGAGVLPAGKSAAEQYDYAFGLLRNSDYDSATRAFQAFLQQHPQDPLAGNSAFWLGQIEYAQGHYDQAAPIFLDAYRKYPKSAKAAESLLKVGMSMGNLGKKAEACAALKRFQTEFSDAADNLKKQASAERTKQGC
jgi:tol-pal system protein YbgF